MQFGAGWEMVSARTALNLPRRLLQGGFYEAEGSATGFLLCVNWTECLWDASDTRGVSHAIGSPLSTLSHCRSLFRLHLVALVCCSFESKVFQIRVAPCPQGPAPGRRVFSSAQVRWLPALWSCASGAGFPRASPWNEEPLPLMSNIWVSLEHLDYSMYSQLATH